MWGRRGLGSALAGLDEVQLGRQRRCLLGQRFGGGQGDLLTAWSRRGEVRRGQCLVVGSAERATALRQVVVRRVGRWAPGCTERLLMNQTRHDSCILASRNDSDKRLVQEGRSPTVPRGTWDVAIGLVVSGLAAYGYLVVSAHLVGPSAYAALSAQWALVLLVGPGIFVTLEQEVGRALSARRAIGLGGRPVVVRSAVAGSAGLLVCAALGAIFSTTLTDRLFDGYSLLLVGSLIGLLGYYVQYSVRGVLAGAGQFRVYSGIVAVEGLLRLLPCVILALLGVRAVGAYGLVFGLAPLTAIVVVILGPRPLTVAGPRASWSELSSALGYLVIASLLSQGLINAPPLAMKLLATPSQEALAGRFLAGLIVARVPLFLFGALQASLLPSLSKQAAGQHWEQFRKGLSRLMVLVVLLGLVSTLAAFSLGPALFPLLFGREFVLGHADFALLAGASAAFMTALALAQALIAMRRYRSTIVAWSFGLTTLLCLLAVQGSLVVRIERSFLLGTLVAAGAMAALTLAALRNPASVLSAEEDQGVAFPEQV
jgi:O-antigen/teichoic acid export membrane protein